MKLLKSAILTLFSLCIPCYADLPPDIDVGSFVVIHTAEPSILGEVIGARAPSSSSTTFYPGSPGTMYAKTYQIIEIKDKWIRLGDKYRIGREIGWLNTDNIIVITTMRLDEGTLKARKKYWDELTKEEKEYLVKNYCKVVRDVISTNEQKESEPRKTEPSSHTNGNTTDSAQGATEANKKQD
jgi:hypothetical protein